MRAPQQQWGKNPVVVVVAEWEKESALQTVWGTSFWNCVTFGDFATITAMPTAATAAAMSSEKRKSMKSDEARCPQALEWHGSGRRFVPRVFLLLVKEWWLSATAAAAAVCNMRVMELIRAGRITQRAQNCLRAKLCCERKPQSSLFYIREKRTGLHWVLWLEIDCIMNCNVALLVLNRVTVTNATVRLKLIGFQSW